LTKQLASTNRLSATQETQHQAKPPGAQSAVYVN
jgi:hypothetical protein